jgi:hypothetical protein
LAAAGWQFHDLEAGSHRCTWCRGRRGRELRRLFRPSRHPGLPNLIVVGAAKCGTTSLYRYLSMHPDITMSRGKEVKFFQNPGCLDRLDVYETFFDRDAPVRGEASTVYSYYPLVNGVPARIRAAIPDVKLVYMVRDPVERLLSHYVQKYADLSSISSFEEAIADIGDPYNDLIAAGRYATQLEQYRQVFESDQLLVLDQAELLLRRGETLRRVFRFLDVDETFSSPRFDEVRNIRATRRHKTPLYRVLSRNAFTGLLRRHLPTRTRRTLFEPLRQATSRAIEPPRAEGELRLRLRDAFRGEVARLREMTGQEFASWQI